MHSGSVDFSSNESGSDFREAGSVIFLSESDACLSLNLVGWFLSLVRDTFSLNVDSVIEKFSKQTNDPNQKIRDDEVKIKKAGS